MAHQQGDPEFQREAAGCSPVSPTLYASFISTNRSQYKHVHGIFYSVPGPVHIHSSQPSNSPRGPSYRGGREAREMKVRSEQVRRLRHRKMAFPNSGRKGTAGGNAGCLPAPPLPLLALHLEILTASLHQMQKCDLSIPIHFLFNTCIVYSTV